MVSSVKKKAIAAAVLFTLPLLSHTAYADCVEHSASSVQDNIRSRSGEKEFVKGKVISDDGEPLVGVMVYIKGSASGVSTDLDGNYSIQAPPEGTTYTLVFHYIGMQPEEIIVGKQRVLDVTLLQDNELEGSMIVGAYGTRQSREDLVGSAFQVNSEQLKDKPKTRVDNLLEGLVPGMKIEPNTDAAGSVRPRYETRIRGEASLNASNEPLWVIDGVPVYTGGTTNIVPGMPSTVSPLSYLDPNDIESITVLKDADQVTIYGANGSNGVILITTKSGSRNVPLNVSATVNFGVAAIDRSTMLKVMDASQYLEVAKEAWTNAGNKPSSFPYQDNEYNSYSTTSTDWADEYLGLGSNLYANVTLSSGTEKVTTQVAGSYYRESDIVRKNAQQRFTFRARNNFKLADWLDFDSILSASLNDNNMFNLGKEYLDTPPIFEPYLPDGSYRLKNMIYDNTGFKYKWFTKNKVPDRKESDDRQKSLKTSANFSLNARIVKGLTVTAQYSIDYTHSHHDQYSSRMTISGIDTSGEPVGYSRRNDASYITWTNVDRINFDRKFGKHSVSAYAGLELHQQKNKYLNASGHGFINDAIKELEYANENTIIAGSNTMIDRTMSYFVRGAYSYDSRYYVSANYRRDGNSNFGTYARWSDFWSAGLSWNIHKEAFFKSNTVSMLKIKASYGTSGNSRVDASQATGTYKYGSSLSYGGSAGAVIGSVPNPGLSWETTRMINAGARIELKDYLAVELEYYNNYTKDLLSKIYVSRTISPDRIYANVGEISNQGVELDITSTNIRRGGFEWTTSFNIAHNRNRITRLYGGTSTSFGSVIWMEGYDANTWYLIEWAGVDPSDGMPMWYDKEGNLTKTYDPTNRKPGKNSTPIVFGGLINTFRYMNWSLSFQINYNIGGYTLPTYASVYYADGYDIISGNQAVEVYHNRWKTPGQPATFPKVSQASTKSGMNSTRFLYDKTYFQLSNLVLSYSFPEKLIRRSKLDGVSVSLIADNLYLLTPDQKRGFNSYKTLKNAYPESRTFTLSFNIKF